MTWLRTLLTVLAASMARTEADIHVPDPVPVARVVVDPLAEEDQVLEAQP